MTADESLHTESTHTDARRKRTERDELAHNLNRIVRQVDGVTDLYDPRPPAVAAVATVIARRFGMQPVVVASSGEGMTVSLSLAVSENHPAAETCRRVFDAVHDYVAAHAPEDTLSAVRIRVSRIG